MDRQCSLGDERENNVTLLPIVRKKLKNLLPIFQRQVDEIKALPGEKIYYSDISELNLDF